MAFCTNCGSRLENKERFCSSCGQLYQADTQPAYQESAPMPHKKPIRTTALVGTLLAVVVLAAGFLGWRLGFLPLVSKQPALAEVTVVVIGETSDTVATLVDGASILLPPGAVPSGTIVNIRQLDPGTAPRLPEWASSVASLYDFTVSQPLQGTVSIRVPLPDSDLSILGHYRDGYWEAVPFVVVDSFALADVDELSLFSWLNTRVADISDKIHEFFTLRFLEEEPIATTDEGLHVDASEALGLISGSAHYTVDNRIRIVIHNTAGCPKIPLPLRLGIR